MQEEWKDVVDYEGKYEVSSLGRLRSVTREVPNRWGTVRTIRGKILKQAIGNTGRYQISLSDKEKKLRTVLVHQLVGCAFIEGFIRGMELNHIDGNPLNNATTNLEISNPSHNQLHAVRTGLTTKIGKSKYRNVTYVSNPRAVKRWVGSVYTDGKNHGWKSFHTEEEAARHVDALLDELGDTERLRNFP